MPRCGQNGVAWRGVAESSHVITRAEERNEMAGQPWQVRDDEHDLSIAESRHGRKLTMSPGEQDLFSSTGKVYDLKVVPSLLPGG